jgi:hypothetical protein
MRAIATTAPTIPRVPRGSPVDAKIEVLVGTWVVFCVVLMMGVELLIVEEVFDEMKVVDAGKVSRMMA